MSCTCHSPPHPLSPKQRGPAHRGSMLCSTAGTVDHYHLPPYYRNYPSLCNPYWSYLGVSPGRRLRTLCPRRRRHGITLRPRRYQYNPAGWSLALRCHASILASPSLPSHETLCPHHAYCRLVPTGSRSECSSFCSTLACRSSQHSPLIKKKKKKLPMTSGHFPPSLLWHWA
jgi:hypothetical protein